MSLQSTAQRTVDRACGACIAAADDDCEADCPFLELRAELERDDGVVVEVWDAPGMGLNIVVLYKQYLFNIMGQDEKQDKYSLKFRTEIHCFR